jgi:phosphonoacetaldehyde dehydrogenase
MTAVVPGFEPACLIGGTEERGSGRVEVVYPFTGEVVGSVPALPADTVRRALELASAARVGLDRYERSRVLERVADAIEATGDDLAALITWESGLALADTRHETMRSVDVFRAAAREALHDDGVLFAGDISPVGRRRRAFTTREPVRLVAAITPFNHPLNQVAHKLAPAIAAGAPIVLKPSEKTPLAALWLAQAVLEAGYPGDALAVVTGDREEILDAMLEHEATEVVMFTGGAEVGKLIAARAGYRRLVLELGGNDPLLVLRDADPDEAARLAVEGGTRNSGQRCTAVKRIVVEEQLADALAELVAERAARLRVGDPFEPATEVGTLIDDEAARRVERRVAAAIGDGSRLLRGGERSGAQIVPPVLDHVPATTELVREETFGPALPLIRVADLDEAIAVANNTRFGLSAGVVSNDLDAITRCIRELRCGTVNVREVPGFRTEETPFGGVKASGLGAKEGVVESIKAMTNVKLATIPWS